jgi:hypothetical protein
MLKTLEEPPWVHLIRVGSDRSAEGSSDSAFPGVCLICGPWHRGRPFTRAFREVSHQEGVVSDGQALRLLAQALRAPAAIR